MAIAQQLVQSREGRVLPSEFSGSPKAAQVTFQSPFTDNNYTVLITSQIDGRAWVADNLTPTGFTINSQANTPPVGLVFWVANHIDDV